MSVIQAFYPYISGIPQKTHRFLRCNFSVMKERTVFIKICYTVTGGYSQQISKLPKRLIANNAGIAKFKTACQKIQYQMKNMLLVYFSLCSMWPPFHLRLNLGVSSKQKCFYVFLSLIIPPMTKKLCSLNLSLIPR